MQIDEHFFVFFLLSLHYDLFSSDLGQSLQLYIINRCIDTALCVRVNTQNFELTNTIVLPILGHQSVRIEYSLSGLEALMRKGRNFPFNGH